MRGESSRITVTNKIIVHISRLATPLFLEFIIARSLVKIIRLEMESSDRRMRDTDETLLYQLDKARSVKVVKLRFERTWFTGMRHLETVSKKKRNFLLKGEFILLTYFLIGVILWAGIQFLNMSFRLVRNRLPYPCIHRDVLRA